MSKLALMRAVRDHLVKSLSLSADSCAIQFEGRPDPSMGRFFVAVHEGTDQFGSEAYLEETLSVDVTITIRTGEIPQDRDEDLYESQASNMEKMDRAIVRALHGNQLVRIAANEYAKAPDALNGDIFQRPLFIKGRSPLTPRGAEWAGDAIEGNDSTFAVRTLNFGGATRIQDLDVMQ